MTAEPDAPWWTQGWVGGVLVSAVAGVAFVTGVEVVLPMMEPAPTAAAAVDERGDDTQLVAATPQPAAAPEPAPAPPAPAAPAPAAPAVAPPAPAPTRSAAEIRKAERAARLRRERRAARELAVLARETFVTWGPIAATWVVPLSSSYRLSSHYGETGPHWETIHTGQDLSAPTGTPVHAATAGVVTFAGDDGPYGNKLEITHPDGNVTWYAHLSRIDVAAGDTVQTGQQVGLVGSTGNSTGPHLHFEVHPGGGDAVDPAAVLREHGVSF